MVVERVGGVGGGGVHLFVSWILTVVLLGFLVVWVVVVWWFGGWGG